MSDFSSASTAEMGTSDRLFLSFRGGDRELALSLATRLRFQGIRVFLDERSIQPGADWRRTLEEELRSAPGVIALIGPKWKLGEHPLKDWVLYELATADRLNKPILPVLIGDQTKLRLKLDQLDTIFDCQAVGIHKPITSRDTRRIVTSLQKMGLGPRLDRSTRDSLWSDEFNQIAADAHDKLRKSDLGLLRIVGPPRSGRTHLLGSIASEAHRVSSATGADPEPLLVAGGVAVDRLVSSGFSIITDWFRDVFRLIEHNKIECDDDQRDKVVGAVVTNGPDLIARGVVPASLLLPLGSNRVDQKVLRAAKRSVNVRSTDPPNRLMRQALASIEQVACVLGRIPVVVIDDVEDLDAASKDLRDELIRSREILVLETGPDDSSVVAKIIAPLDDSALQARGIRRELLQANLRNAQVTLEPEGAVTAIAALDPYYWWPAMWELFERGQLTEKIPFNGPQRIWQCAEVDSDRTAMPDKNTLIESVITDLVPSSLRAVLVTASLMTQPLDFDIAVQATGRNDAIALWDELRNSDPDGDVVRHVPGKSRPRLLGFAHPDVPEYLRAQLPHADMQRRHRALAAATHVGIDQLDGDLTVAAWRCIAVHLSAAGDEVEGADAFRRAAMEAELQLDVPTAMTCYQDAARLLSRCLARADGTEDDIAILLPLVNTSYRLARISRLGTGAMPHGSERDDDASQDDPKQTESNPHHDQQIQFREVASEHLKILEDRIAGSWHENSDAPVNNPSVPTTDRRVFNRRLSHALNGYLDLEYAMDASETGKRKDAFHYLYSTMKHADLAYGEGQAHWLLLSALARYADLLADEALDASEKGEKNRVDMLVTETLLTTERVLAARPRGGGGEEALSPIKDFARVTQARVQHLIAREPRSARWLFSLREHSADLPQSDQLRGRVAHAAFELSTIRAADTSSLDDLEALLVEIRNDATEAAIDGYTAHARYWLARVKLLKNDQLPEARKEAWKELNHRVTRSLKKSWRDRQSGLKDVLAHFEGQADLQQLFDSADGRREIIRSLREVPGIIAHLHQNAVEPDAELAAEYKAAEEYLTAAANPDEDSFETMLWECLMPSRLTKERVDHAHTVYEFAKELVAATCPDAGPELLQDLKVAAAIHDWYADAHSPILRSMAIDYSLNISGHHWFDPDSLHGPVAAEVIGRVYGAERILGTERYDRIRKAVTLHTVGQIEAEQSPDRTTMLLYVADHLAGSPRSRTNSKKTLKDRLSAVDGDLVRLFRSVESERRQLARDNGIVVVSEGAEPTIDLTNDREHDQALPTSGQD